YIERWGLMYNVHVENIQEHSLQVAVIAHTLAIVRNELFGGSVNPERVAVLALYHDVSEVITGDLPTPIKYFNPQINRAYKDLEEVANERIHGLLPEALQASFNAIFFPTEADQEHWLLVKAADKLAAYVKCLEELKLGNQEFAKAKHTTKQAIDDLDLPEVRYFLKTFLPSMTLTLDELD
ncbi:MAG: 5'-deoxynucleotidase, partial [Anaerolineales bacterium]|nr:5'-deoxynucleotidase [Anaerolineales bacterium]